ncbi:Os05g0521800 [Oryza sativa Japonica Group]|uniref:Os05g0521800 protein n=1 Tax=Oryza sativa subsp. japonica TaxID=39947 RepID=Q0DGN0_ORYSJ|nr:Os05g0521800 [Oryza sativa Japonica Group]|eukprot:NP_001056079.1 Os05g0521800 [Oryza sativa Japonica Group]
MDPNFPYQSPSFTLGDFDPNYMSGFDGTSGSAPTPPSVEEVPVHTAVVEEVPVQAATASEGFSGTASGSVSTHTGSKRSRTSVVWQNFDEIKETCPDGREVSKARCRICRQILSARSSGGTGHLKRHAESCAKKQGIQLRQQQLMVNPDGTVRSWEYDPMVARESLVRLIARQDLPLNFGESPAFEHYIQQSHNPRFKAVSRQTSTRDLENVYHKEATALKELFSTCTFSVSVTSDIWSSGAREDYLSVVVHFVDDDWQLQKRVLGLRLIDVSHTGENIAERIREVINEFNLADKIFAVTLDNASANSRAIEILQPLFCVYAQSFLLHQRCACHIINLIVKTGMKRSRGGPRNSDGSSVLNEHVWAIVQKFHQFLETFYDCTLTLSQVYYPTANIILHNLLEIATLFKEYENDDVLTEPVFHMKQKYLKYWKNIPMLYAFAFVLDPRCKLRGLSAILSLVGDTIGVDYSSFYTEVRRKLYEVFRRYEVKFQEVRQQRPPPIPTTGKKKIQWGRIWGGSSSSSIQGGGSSSATSGDASSHVVAEELSGYLDSDAIHHEAQDFNVLGWWNDHKITYPVLSKLARDVLTVPVSTVSSESAFSLCGRIIEDRRTTLRSDHVEMLLSVKDWELARQHAQYTADNQELAAQFEQLYLDPDQPQ